MALGLWRCDEPPAARNAAPERGIDLDPTRGRRARLSLDTRAVLRLYIERVPEVGYEGSCIFHGKQGCTLDRSLRSDVCNSYFCGGLQVYMKGGDTVTPTLIIAGVGDKMRTSPILMR